MSEGDVERTKAREKVQAVLNDEDGPILDCPLCDGQIGEVGEELVCDLCCNKWSADDVAKQNRL